MFHRPIHINQLSFILPHKICFEDFNAQILYGSRIAIIGSNGSGKSSLLKMIQGTLAPSHGNIVCPEELTIGYVPQLIDSYDSLSGGQRFQKALSSALVSYPNMLLLDEPTNHLDKNNKKSLLRMLAAFSGTLLIASHDVTLLKNVIDIFWHIDQGQIHIFQGSYDNYFHEFEVQRTIIEEKRQQLKREKKSLHESLMQEQERAKKSNQRGEKSIRQRKWPTIVSDEKARRGLETSGKKRQEIDQKQQTLNEQWAKYRLPEKLMPKFSLNASDIGLSNILTIAEASIGYHFNNFILQNICLTLTSHQRLAILGNNGCGKSTLIKAILDDPAICKSGRWITPKATDIGYLDQHYYTLSPQKSVLETIQVLRPDWSHGEVRQHLNNFLFRKNEEVNTLVNSLSGGEKARLTLAQIGAQTPKLLILDELTNNLDLETRAYVIQVLKAYPGALLVISHDEDFLSAIDVQDYLEL